MSNDEQRLQLLKTLRNKLSYYNLDWFDIQKIIELFSTKDSIRFDILQFLLLYIKNLTKKLNLDQFISLSNQCTNNNEYLKVRLIEQLYEKINMENKNDVEKILNLFQIINLKQKVENFIRNNRSQIDIQLTSYPDQATANNILSPTSSLFQEASLAPLKRKYENYSCQQMITPLLLKQEDEFIQQTISISSSDSSLSTASDENIPIRTRSFMIAIKNTFERKEKNNQLKIILQIFLLAFHHFINEI